MMRRAAIAGIAIALAAGPAAADDMATLEARGERLAKQGEFTEAITVLKQADEIQQRAEHSCIIGLAYLRRELLPQAELYFATCHARATPSDGVPNWTAEAEQQLAGRIAKLELAPVTVRVVPVGPSAEFTVSGFSPDERFPLQPIHLAPGTYVIEISAPGYAHERREIHVERGKPIELELALTPVVVQPTVEYSRVPWFIIGGGAAIVAAGFAYDGLVLQPTRTDVLGTSTGYKNEIATARREQAATIALWSAGGVAVIVGIVLRSTVYKHHPHEPRISASVGAHGSILSLEWER